MGQSSQAKLADVRQKLGNLQESEHELQSALRSCDKGLRKQDAHNPILQDGDARNNVFQPVPRVVHSSRSRIIGSIESARCAGIHVATSPSNDIARTVPANTSGSRGVA